MCSSGSIVVGDCNISVFSRVYSVLNVIHVIKLPLEGVPVTANIIVQTFTLNFIPLIL